MNVVPMSPRAVPRQSESLAIGLVIAGVVAAACGPLVDPATGFGAMLVAALFGVSLSLGAAVFLAVHGVARAGWHRPVARVAYAIAAAMVVALFALAVVLSFGLRALYPWTNPEVVAASHVLMAKAAWLQPSWFWLRAAVVATLWLALIAAMQAPLARFRAGNDLAMRRISAVFLVLLAPTLSIGSWDWTMSLEPEWFSTMWTLYRFAGTFLAGIAVVTLATLYLERRGELALADRASVHHDLGRLLFGFASFWAYIWFCQFMLIWYANLPEETTWYAHRMSGAWSTLYWLDPILNWVVPFVFLLSVRAKRDPATLAQVCLVVLAGQWLDNYLQVMPALSPAPVFPGFALAATAAVLAGMWMVARRSARL